MKMTTNRPAAQAHVPKENRTRRTLASSKRPCRLRMIRKRAVRRERVNRPSGAPQMKFNRGVVAMLNNKGYSDLNLGTAW